MGNILKKTAATFSKIMGNVSQNDGQRFLKLRAMIFQTMGNVFEETVVIQNK